MLSFPFDSRVTYSGGIPTYDRAVSSQPLRELIKDLFTTGIMPNPSTCFQVSAGEEGMTVSVSAGYAVINGGLMQEEETRILEVSAADLVNDRIDTVVLRWNENVDVRTADLYIVTGTPASEPVRPELTRSGSIYEIGLADLFIAHGTTSMSNERITDTRYETERCGIVSSVSEWDTTTIYQQVQADLANFQNVEEAEFMDWFDRMKDQLSEDAAGHLQNEIDAITQDIADIESEIDGLLKPRLYVYADTNTTVTAVKGTTTITATEIDTGLYMCDLNDYGTWTIYGTMSGSAMQTVTTVDTVKEYTINFINGNTATPTDNVEILLQCAGIYDSEITTISDLLADDTALLTVISSNNAMDYMARSTTWITSITQSQSAMNYIGLNNYASNKLLGVSGWREGICTSGYYESVLNAKIPIMTSNNTPSGECSFVNVTGSGGSGVGAGSPYNAFDGNNSTSIQMSGNQGATGRFIYKFDSPLKVYRMDAFVINTYSVQYSQAEGQYLKRIIKSTDGTNWDVLMNCYSAPTNTPNYSKNFDNDADAQWFAIELVNARYNQGWTGVYECQFYGRRDV